VVSSKSITISASVPGDLLFHCMKIQITVKGSVTYIVWAVCNSTHGTILQYLYAVVIGFCRNTPDLYSVRPDRGDVVDVDCSFGSQ